MSSGFCVPVRRASESAARKVFSFMPCCCWETITSLYIMRIRYGRFGNDGKKYFAEVKCFDFC